MIYLMTETLFLYHTHFSFCRLSSAMSTMGKMIHLITVTSFLYHTHYKTSLFLLQIEQVLLNAESSIEKTLHFMTETLFLNHNQWVTSISLSDCAKDAECRLHNWDRNFVPIPHSLWNLFFFIPQIEEELQSAESTIETLQYQLQELGGSDSLTRARHQHEAVVTSLQHKHKLEIVTLKENLDTVQHNLGEKVNLWAYCEQTMEMDDIPLFDTKAVCNIIVIS